MQKLIPFLNWLFSFFVLIVIVILAIYLGVSLYNSSYNLVIFLASGNTIWPEETRSEMLLGIARIVIWIKAYKLLSSYLAVHHVSVKYIMEIAIITSTVEILFAYHSHTLPILIVFAAFGSVNLLMYLFFFGAAEARGASASQTSIHK